MTTAVTAERAVREYLLLLDDPEQLIDHELVRRLEADINNTSDPLDRLKAIADYERARRPDEDAYREAFIEHAKTWAADNQIPVAAFEQLGVPTDVLLAAGIIARGSRSRTSGTHKSATSVEELKTAIQAMRGPFTVADLAQSVGGSPMTIRKALTQSIEEGIIRRLGPIPNWTSRGRAPVQYEPAS